MAQLEIGSRAGKPTQIKKESVMFPLPQEVQNVLSILAPLFTPVVFIYVQILATGAILCTGKRTVTSALKATGHGQDKDFTNYYRVFNRAQWNTLQGAKIMLGLLIALVPPTWPLIILIDETIERRKGKKIKAKGCYRDPVLSSGNTVVHCFGLKWISMTLVVWLPWSRRPWALPFLTVLAPSPASNEAQGKRHKTTVDWACQMIRIVSRWVGQRTIVLVGDGTYAAIKLGHCCVGLPPPVILVSRLRMDAALYDFPGEQPPGKKGKKQRSLLERSKDPSTQWTPIKITWYDGVKRNLEIFWGVSLWYTQGQDPLAIKWVVVRDPKGQLRTEAFFSTDLEVSAVQILEWFVLRWNAEVTFQEMRTHLGFETQRQWSDLAIERTTPALFSLFSLVVLMALEIAGDEPAPVKSYPWYTKSEATFSDIIALVRRHIWTSRLFADSPQKGDFAQFDPSVINTLLDLVCYPA
jgi:hypothetical protein